MPAIANDVLVSENYFNLASFPGPILVFGHLRKKEMRLIGASAAM